MERKDTESADWAVRWRLEWTYSPVIPGRLIKKSAGDLPVEELVDSSDSREDPVEELVASSGVELCMLTDLVNCRAF